jgi:hypothetical protein
MMIVRGKVFLTDFRASEASRCGCVSRFQDCPGEHLISLVRVHFKDCLAVTEAGTQQILRDQAERHLGHLLAERVEITPLSLMDELIAPSGRFSWRP